jgi:HK97 family phage major capsid protein
MRQTIEIPVTLYREFPVELGERQESAEGGGERYPVSFSSETPIRRFSWDIGEYREVLSHKPEDVDLSRAERGLPALKSHSRMDQFGSVTAIRIDETARKSRGMLGFSSIPLGVEQKTLVDEGHLHTVSVGYEVTEMRLLEVDENGIPTYSCKWIPFEFSTEPVPADFGVGFGRSDRESQGELKRVEIDVVESAGGEERGMSKTEERTAGARPDEGTPPKIEERAEPKLNARDFGSEAAEISEMCSAHNLSERAAGWIRERLSPDQVGRKILELKRTQGEPAPASEALDEMPTRDKARYSVRRALAIAANAEKFDGLEAEVHEELKVHRSGGDHGGILIPWRLRGEREFTDYAKRTLGTGEATGGATLVGEVIMPDMIDLLRNRALCLLAGARLYPGLSGVVQFNRKTSAPTVYWIEENPAADVTAGEPTYGYTTLAPKTLIGSVQVPRQLLTMATIDVEADIRNDLAIGHALALDLAALHGSGTDKEPEGIYSAAGVLSEAFGGVPTLAHVSAMVGKIADANADVGSLSWMATALLAELCTRTAKEDGYPVYLWNGSLSEGTMLGYPARATNQLSKTLGAGAEHGMIFGNWNDLLMGLFGNDLEVVVDTVTKAKRGQIVITSYSMADTAIRHGASFCKATGATLS